MRVSVLFVCAALVFLPAAAVSAAPPEPLRVGSEIGFPPYADADSNGKAVGFSVDLFDAVARVMEIPVEYRVSDWSVAWNGLRTGELDALPLVARLKEREEALEYTSVHTIGYDSFFVRKGGPRIAAIEERAPNS